MVPAVVEDAAEDLLPDVLIEDTDNILRVIVTIFIGNNVSRLHIPLVQTSS